MIRNWFPHSPGWRRPRVTKDMMRTQISTFERLSRFYRQHPDIYRGDYSIYLRNGGDFALRRHRLEEAQNLLAEAVANFEKYEGAGSRHLALASTSLAEVYEDEGKYSES